MTKKALQSLLTLLGRKGKMPWLRKRFRRSLPYIKADEIVLMPVAHMLLHGLCKDLFQYALGDHSYGMTFDAVIFTEEQRDAVKVCMLSKSFRERFPSPPLPEPEASCWMRTQPLRAHYVNREL